MPSKRIITNLGSDLTSFFGSFRSLSILNEKQPKYNLGVGNINYLNFLDDLLSGFDYKEFKNGLNLARNYPGTQGLSELNQLLTELIKKENKISVSPNQIILTHGAVGALQTTFFVCSDAFQKTIYALPSFPYWAMAERAQVSGKYFFSKNANDYTTGFGDYFVKETDSDRLVKTVIVENPHSPFGVNLAKEQFKLIVDESSRRGIRLIYDDVYRNLIKKDWYGKKLDFDNTVLIDSFSKRCAMPGLRLGFAIVPEREVPLFRAAVANESVGVSGFSSFAAFRILQYFMDNNLFKKLRIEIEKRQSILNKSVKKLKKFSIVSPKPASGIYRILDLKQFIVETGLSLEQSNNILLKNGVKLITNDYFYPNNISKDNRIDFLRISVGGDKRIKEAMDIVISTFEEIYFKSRNL